ncbi:MAG TPA: hypothetical protein PLH11_09870 [Gemmobacter sp.]|nr:hypothetical protein [Gemmobacter sp.]
MNRIENGENLFLLTGEICDGKTLIMEQIAAALSLTRPVLFLQYALMSTTQEVLRLLHTSPNAVVIIENCFDFRPESLNEIMTAFAGKTAVLLMTAHSLSARAEASEAEKMKQNKSLHHIRIPRLDETEALQLIRYTDMIGNWTQRPMSPSEKLRYVMHDCKASLPTFLMELLNSEVVRDAYKMEFNRVASSSSRDAHRVLVATFYLSHIGHIPTAQELSNLLELDAARCIRSLDGSNNQLELLREVRGEIHTVPSIGARNILRQIIPTQYPALVVDTVVQMLHALSDHSYYREFTEAVKITARLLHAPRKTHYPYATLIEHMGFIEHHLSSMSEDEKAVCLKAIMTLGREAHRHLEALEEGHPRSTGRAVLEQLDAFQKRHPTTT